MLNKKITIIGAGNMGQAIAHGLLQKKAVKPKNLVLADSATQKLNNFKKLRVVIEKNNQKACTKSDIILLAVKPQALEEVLEGIKDSTTKDQLIISIAAGISIKKIKNILGTKQPVVRVMPNLCAQIGESMSGWVKSKEVSAKQVQDVKIILDSIGTEIEFKKEDKIDKVTAVAGSGPAYIFYLVEILEKSATKLGFKKNDAKVLAQNTLIGAAKFLVDSADSANSLRRKVTSKGGTTEAAFKKINNSQFEKIFVGAVKAAYERAKSFSKNS